MILRLDDSASFLDNLVYVPCHSKLILFLMYFRHPEIGREN